MKYNTRKLATSSGEVTIPRRFERIIDRVNQRDREYFEQHPSASYYRRPYIPGEFWPAAPRRTRPVTVHGYGDSGIRVRRMGLIFVVDFDSPEAEALAPYFLPRPTVIVRTEPSADELGEASS